MTLDFLVRSIVALRLTVNTFHQDSTLFKLLRFYKLQACGFSPRLRFVQVASILQSRDEKKWGDTVGFPKRAAIGVVESVHPERTRAYRSPGEWFGERRKWESQRQKEDPIQEESCSHEESK